MNGTLLITPGEPGGVGPDIICSLAQHALPYPVCAVANAQMLADRAQQLGLDLKILKVGVGIDAGIESRSPDSLSIKPLPAGSLAVVDIPLGSDVAVQAGLAHKAHGEYVLRCLDVATDACLAAAENGRVAALVTGPINKASIIDAGFPHFSGHTEYLAQRCNTSRVVMMLASDSLRVALATTHIPLLKVSESITAHALEQTLRILHAELRERFAIAQPTISVCGLNPHAGEQGHLGTEEIDTIIPVCKKLRSDGMSINGPLPADTAFTPRALQGVDAVLAMYHDQGLPVIKHASFGSTVNITLGLPIVRTSVDHGTALDIAGTGKANTDSLKAALDCAYQLADGSGKAANGE